MELLELIYQVSVLDNFVFFLLCLVHRDIKPQNILLFPNGSKFNAKLSDFGLSKNLSQLSSSTHSGGSLGWMAPEVESGESGELVCQSCGFTHKVIIKVFGFCLACEAV